MKSPIRDRLEATLKMDAINGDSFERAIVASQIREAITEITVLFQEIARLKSEREAPCQEK
jgi:hypothetical protein